MEMYFVPGMTWNNLNDPASIQTPWGIWGTGPIYNRVWIPQQFINGDLGHDFGLVIIPPNDSGQWIGDVTGTWPIAANTRFGPQDKVWIMGYPAKGWWNTRDGANGRGQWGCNTSYDGEYSQEGTGWQLWSRCSANQGASGGPWFVQFTDGSWQISAVTSMCNGGQVIDNLPCQRWGDWVRGLDLQDSFLALWNYVVGG
jgi:hypothetical protein